MSENSSDLTVLPDKKDSKRVLYFVLKESGYQASGSDGDSLFTYIKSIQQEMANDYGRPVKWNEACYRVMDEARRDFEEMIRGGIRSMSRRAQSPVEPNL